MFLFTFGKYSKLSKEPHVNLFGIGDDYGLAWFSPHGKEVTRTKLLEFIAKLFIGVNKSTAYLN